MNKKVICAHEYKDRDGQPKTSWRTVGYAREANGKLFLDLNHMPGVTLMIVEDDRDKPSANDDTPF